MGDLADPVWVKICGLRHRAAVEAAVEAGADAVGFICDRSSPRYVEPHEIRRLAEGLPPRVWKVGVFRETSERELREVLEAAGLDTVQLHGFGTPAMIASLQNAGWRVIRALGLQPQPGDGGRPDVGGQAGDDRRSDSRGQDGGVALLPTLVEMDVPILLDSWGPRGGGGTGVLGDWRQAAEIVGRFPGARIALAGGLTPDNVAEAIRTVRPWGVDVSSGVEKNGQKDPERIRAFVAAAISAVSASLKLALSVNYARISSDEP